MNTYLTLSLSVWNTRDNESSEWMSQKIDLYFGQKPETHLMLSTPVAISKSAQFAILLQS